MLFLLFRYTTLFFEESNFIDKFLLEEFLLEDLSDGDLFLSFILFFISVKYSKFFLNLLKTLLLSIPLSVLHF